MASGGPSLPGAASLPAPPARAPGLAPKSLAPRPAGSGGESWGGRPALPPGCRPLAPSPPRARTPSRPSVTPRARTLPGLPRPPARLLRSLRESSLPAWPPPRSLPLRPPPLQGRGRGQLGAGRRGRPGPGRSLKSLTGGLDASRCGPV